MSVIRGTLGQEKNDKVQYIYPKTLSELVEYDSTQNVKEKINTIDKNIEDIVKRVDNISSGISYGSLDTKNDAELFDIRIPNYNVIPEGTTYNSAGNAIRSQFEALFDIINDIKKDVEEIKKYIN